MTLRELHRRVALWQRRLALLGFDAWRFTISIVDHIEDDADDDPQARADVAAYYNTVTFLFRKATLAERRAAGTLDELIVHEWLHVADRNQDHIVRQLMSYLPQTTRDELEIQEEAAREGRIEQMARLIVSLHAKTC